jgi:hypothetical protein
VNERIGIITAGGDCPRRSAVIRAICFAATLLVCGEPVCAQGNAAEDSHPLQGADTSSPRATLMTFLEACDEVYHRARGEGRNDRSDAERRMVTARILRCLDLRVILLATAQETAEPLGRQRL